MRWSLPKLVPYLLESTKSITNFNRTNPRATTQSHLAPDNGSHFSKNNPFLRVFREALKKLAACANLNVHWYDSEQYKPGTDLIFRDLKWGLGLSSLLRRPRRKGCGEDGLLAEPRGKAFPLKILYNIPFFIIIEK